MATTATADATAGPNGELQDSSATKLSFGGSCPFKGRMGGTFATDVSDLPYQSNRIYHIDFLLAFRSNTLRLQ